MEERRGEGRPAPFFPLCQWFMAFRYLRAHKIIYFSIAGVAIGIMTLVMVTSIMSGFQRDMRARIRGLQTDLVVTSYDRGFWFPDYEDLCDLISKLPHVRGCAPRIEYPAWIGRRGVRREVQVVGILPGCERGVSQLDHYFRQGGRTGLGFESGGEPGRRGLVLGCELWHRGWVHLTTVRDASPLPVVCSREFETVGNFRTGMNEYDSGYVFMDLADAQAFLHLDQPPVANTLVVKVDDYEKYGGAVVGAILEALHARKPCSDPSFHRGAPGHPGHCGPFRVMTWEQTRSILLQAVQVEKGIQIILLFLIILVAGFNIIAIYTLVVRSKTRDIGILRALGVTERGVVSIFLTSGGLCGLVGSVFGIALGLLMAYNVNGIADFIRVVSRELNRMGFQGEGPSRAWLRGTVLALLAAGGILVATWRVFYKERQRVPWVRALGGVLALGLAAYLSFRWLSSYTPLERYDPAFGKIGPGGIAVLGAGIWAAFLVLWRFLDRWRRHPGWIFFGFFGTLLFSAYLLAILGVLLIGGGILLSRLGADWPGLELFPRQIYYLDRIPVFVDFQTLGFIVGLTLLVSVIFSVYPALRAAQCDPIEAIRDE